MTQTSKLHQPGRVPVFDRPDRLRKALRTSGVSVSAMADVLEVQRNTVGRYINGHSPVPTAVLIVWSQVTGVSLAWLRDGSTTDAADIAAPSRTARAAHLHPMRRATDYAQSAG